MLPTCFPHSPPRSPRKSGAANRIRIGVIFVSLFLFFFAPISPCCFRSFLFVRFLFSKCPVLTNLPCLSADTLLHDRVNRSCAVADSEPQANASQKKTKKKTAISRVACIESRERMGKFSHTTRSATDEQTHGKRQQW